MAHIEGNGWPAIDQYHRSAATDIHGERRYMTDTEKAKAASCHACGLGYRCWNPQCQNTNAAPSPLMGPWSGSEIDHTDAELTRLRAIEVAARDVCAAARKIHETRVWPTKYGMPFGELKKLEEALAND